MRIRSFLAWAGCLLLAAPAAVYAASLSNADRQFLMTAARTDMVIAHEGEMAQNQAKRDDVKTFGKTLAQDEADDYAHLSKLATKTGVSIPNGINVAKERTIEQLARLKGSSFDRQFTMDEIQADRQAIAMFKREAAHCRDTDLKDYASKTIPVLEKHLQIAEQCAKSARHS